MDIVLSLKDAEWIATQYPGLKIDMTNKCIVGDIYLNRTYNGTTLTNIFSIKVMLELLPNMVLPKVYETSNKLQNIANRLELSKIEDIHVNNDKSLCLAIYGREEECFSDKFTIKEFFENCLEPYFFWVSYYEKFGKPPWKDYAHGGLGFIEMYAEDRLTFREVQQKMSLREISKYLYHYDCVKNKCLCGKNKDMKKCHSDIYIGLKKFKENWNLARVS